MNKIAIIPVLFLMVAICGCTTSDGTNNGGSGGTGGTLSWCVPGEEWHWGEGLELVIFDVIGTTTYNGQTTCHVVKDEYYQRIDYYITTPDGENGWQEWYDPLTDATQVFHIVNGEFIVEG